MEPLDLSLIMPNAHIKDIEFVSLSLKLNPSERITAKDALTNIYFQGTYIYILLLTLICS